MATSERPRPVARLLDELTALERAYSRGHHGRWSASRRAAFVDACLVELFEAAEPAPGIALVALGGYGRARLSPRSDLDVLIAHDGVDPGALGPTADAMLYPLWDAGFRVGHGVRTPEESAALADERLDARTAMLDGRLLAGDAEPWERTRAAVLARVRADPRAFARALEDDAAARRERFGTVSSFLEPDLKQGTGGLRDVQRLGWLAHALGAPVVELGVLGASEAAAVDAADEFLERVRAALHLASGRDGDRVRLDDQPSIAAEMGFADEPGLPAVDALMRQVFEHARQVEHVATAAFSRTLADEVAVVALEPTAAGVLRALVDAVGRGDGAFPASLLDRIAATTIPDDVGWTDDVRDAFLELVRAGPRGVHALETLDRLGLLSRYLRAWRDVRCRPQRDPYHRYSVDEHLLTALREMHRLLEGDTDEPLAALGPAVADRDGLVLGALFHDIGKVGRGSHVPEGARIAAETLERMRIAEPARSFATFLVEEHLLLSDTATRRDLQDEDLIHDVAARVGDEERLAGLALLAVADAAATGPLAWTPWRAALVRELVAKVQRVFERGDVGPETAARLAERVDELRELLAGEDPDQVERFFLRMPRRYLMGVDPREIATHYPLLVPRLQPTEVRTRSSAGTQPGTYALTVVALDRPGLLSMIAGALSLAGLSILTAQAFTTEDGVAVDVFEVEGAFDPEVGEARWRDLRSTLRRAIEGRLSLAHGVEERRRRYASQEADVPVTIEVQHDASDFSTVIEIGAPDRVGLLFDITRTFAEFELDVHLAKVATYGGRVVDAFYVRDAVAGKVTDPERLEALRLALAERLSSATAASRPAPAPDPGP